MDAPTYLICSLSSTWRNSQMNEQSVYFMGSNLFDNKLNFLMQMVH